MNKRTAGASTELNRDSFASSTSCEHGYQREGSERPQVTLSEKDPARAHSRAREKTSLVRERCGSRYDVNENTPSMPQPKPISARRGLKLTSAAPVRTAFLADLAVQVHGAHEPRKQHHVRCTRLNVACSGDHLIDKVHLRG